MEEPEDAVGVHGVRPSQVDLFGAVARFPQGGDEGRSGTQHALVIGTERSLGVLVQKRSR
ncbi:hypothetical protein NMG29_39255 [Streptomyces cocklensis]|uniref:hypothetical protein n=1 Tax=Actinacidiphila cocklensis TaxID=887465 RepID=UPI00203F28AF|nr:hypothetical protein [Actinacidiphila cocklensis]MDD1064120.1 hypothetical protein [Actinacidiphila cocklensis]